MPTQATLAELAVLRCHVRDQRPDAAAAELAAARAGLDAPTGLDTITTGCGLSDFERSVLLLAAGPDLVGAVAQELEQRTGVPYLTFGSALALLPDAHWSATAPPSGLRRWLLLEPEDPSRLLTSRLVVDERILHLLAGLDVPDERVVLVSHVLEPPGTLPGAWEQAADRLAVAWASGPVRLTGAGPRDAAAVAARAAQRSGRPLRELAGADLSSYPDDVGRFARAAAREVRLGTTAFWVDLTALPDEAAARVQRAFAGVPMVTFMGGSALPFQVPRPAHAEWAALLAARAPASEDPLTWSDLVLPESQLAQLRGLVAAVRQRGRVLDEWGFARRRHRGLGTSALFVGPSGTGKTFAAEVVAAELERELVQIDLSQVVSKYIGETEKQLARLFDEAEQNGSVLFFDEADALFGKRTEVKDSHDRYANIEVSYLLQRLERFSGLAILASNARAALDTAFLRRLTSVVVFPHPDADARLALWQRAFPDAMPRGDLDLPALSRVDATGATIMAAALAGAYLAADAGEPVGTGHVMRALDWELAKSGRPAMGGRG
ncbi:ATP-binding protein [Propioniciclava sinopodophylli]|uniref:ATP-binding protein n=1 Tax=Propioniciclava sinopodophylli TaxID=1837344 RepID=UPI0024908495|nr:ATP-binding protein [Propioniciclava sinopodophylli]